MNRQHNITAHKYFHCVQGNTEAHLITMSSEMTVEMPTFQQKNIHSLLLWITH